MKSEASTDDCNLSLDCMAVLVSDGEPIQERVTLRWKEKAYVCWIMEDFRPWVPDFVGTDEPRHNSDEETIGEMIGNESKEEGCENEVGSVSGNDRVAQGLHGDFNPNDNVFVYGNKENGTNRWRRRRKTQRLHGLNTGPALAQNNSPEFARAKKRARNEEGPLDPEIIPPINWPFHITLDLNNNPISMIPEDSISQVPDTMIDTTDPEVKEGEMATSVIPQTSDDSPGLRDPVSTTNTKMLLEVGEFRYPFTQVDLQKEIDATIEIAEKVGIMLVDHQEAVKLAIIEEETQLSEVSKIRTGILWGKSKYEFEGVGANGRSGGLLSIWDPGIFQKIKVVVKKNFLLISGKITGYQEMFNIVNVYGPQILSDKKDLWVELEKLKNEGSGLWVFAGDFNEVRNSSERLNSDFSPQGANLFNQFIFNAQLMEYNMGGHPFTYMRGFGSSYSKLDRFLVCDDFVNRWPNACARSLPRHLSDHSPIILITSNIDFGSTPFRFFSSWFKYQGIEEVVKSTLGMGGTGNKPDKILASKLTLLKETLREWIKIQKFKNESNLTSLKLTSDYYDKEASIRRPGLVTATPFVIVRRHPFSRSYGAILPIREHFGVNTHPNNSFV
ncbi:hypothetical protein E3N88_06224 [Mikania micrantha]|uniref:Endonuclease/exonuclease/phosphatase domain-containing protein n=1 Tax=Mikania micrantha TaxID=192012 RepID=A0A5N6PN72_9ASTR|nr:hypothetical protein E3N88_06224 [Mikania micrantha]